MLTLSGVISLTFMLNTSTAIEVHNFHEGTNASVTFFHWLNESSSYTLELFSLNEAQPFYKDEQIDPLGLQPGQYGRFSVKTERLGKNLTATLYINNIQQGDEGVYISSLREIANGTSSTHIKDAYIDVIAPLGMAECSVRVSLYTSHYNEVSCHATLGSDGKGFLLCYQNFEKAPTTGDVERSTDFIRASFWMLRDSSIYCCSFKSDEDMNQDSCTDFVYHPDRTPHEITSVMPSETMIRDQQSTVIMSTPEDDLRSASEHFVTENQHISLTYYLVIASFACLVINNLIIVTFGVSILALHLRQHKKEKRHWGKVCKTSSSHDPTVLESEV